MPVRITSATDERVISVDGAWGAPGLNLSHWPGNSTPPDLAHDLSTGAALNFARLPRAEREKRTAGCVAICNNHYDTDGLCALLAVRSPELALPRADALVSAARAGDFFQVPDERSFIMDRIIAGLVDPARSPWSSDIAGLTDVERYTLCTNRALELLPGWVDGELADWATLWEAPLERLRADRAELERAAKDELVHFDFTIWTGQAGATEERAFDPGRHALFGLDGTGGSDRHLVVDPRDSEGTTYRLIVGTRSWFELVSNAPPPRPDLAEIARALNEREGCSAGADVAWRHHDPAGASPELWFGSSAHEHFAEHAQSALKPSSIEPTEVKAIIVDALRAAWVFPDECDEAWDDVAAGTE